MDTNANIFFISPSTQIHLFMIFMNPNYNHKRLYVYEKVIINIKVRSVCLTIVVLLLVVYVE